MRISDWSSDVCSSDLLRQQLWTYVRELNAGGVTVVLTTHYLEEAEELCDRIAIINHGRLIANEATRDLVNMAQEKLVVVTIDRSEERRVGKECVITCRFRGSADP